MADQSFQSHAHHPVLTYVAALFWLIAFVLLITQVFFGWNATGWILAAILASMAPVIWHGRTYTVRLQDRIIMTEVKIRAAELLASGQDAQLAKLSPKQIAALRFASDEEFGSLLERAARENLSPKDIKSSIRTWRPDLYRT